MTKKPLMIFLVLLFTASAIIALPIMNDSLVTGQEVMSPSIDIHGPYVDTIVFKIIEVEETAILALQAGEVDLYNERVPAELVGRLLGLSDIYVNKTQGVYFRHVSFNCEKFPLNYSAVRRAIVQAVDKWKIVDEATLGLGFVADTPVPPLYELYSIEDEFDVHYYDPLPALANETLSAAGFVDIDDDGWREGPHGEEILIEIDVSDYPPAMDTCYVIEEGAESVGLNTEVNVVEWDLQITRFETGVFHATCFTWDLGVPDPTHLNDFFRTGELYNDLICRFSNSTYDDAADALMTAETLQDAIDAAVTCQEILMWEQPMLVAYVDSLTHAFRVDDWEGWQIVVGSGFMEPDTWYKVRLKEEAGGPLGGTLTIAQPEPLSTTNILTTDDGYVADVMDCIYQPLYDFDVITWADISAPGLAESWTVEETTDPKGIKVTFNLIQNATWHDGEPVTSEDVKFTYDIIQHSQAPYLFDNTKNIYKIEAPDDYTVVIYSNSSGLFEFHNLNLDWILPKHIWNAHWDDVLTWVPEGSDLIGSGPFKWNDWIAGEYIELVAYDNWPYKPVSTSTIDVDVEPASVSAGTNFGVVVTIDNTGIVPFTDMDVKITLPAGTSLATGTSTITINRIAPGTSEMVTWVVNGETAGTYTITVDAESTQYTGQQTASVEVVTYIYYYIAGIAVVALVALVGGYILIRRRD